MKKSIITLTALSLTIMTLAAHFTTAPATTSEQLGERIISALKATSTQQFEALYPALNDFQQIMAQSSGIYGNTLEAAQQEFAYAYSHTLLPAVRQSFQAVIAKGREAGIDWTNVRFESVEVAEKATHTFDSVPVTIVFTSNGQQHRLRIERALVIGGQFRVSQFISLI